MRIKGLNRTHVGILRYVYEMEMTVSMIARGVGKSISWTSGCVDQLVEMDLVIKRREGLEVFVGQASNELSQNMAILLFEGPMIDLSKVLDSAGLMMLPVLLDPGSTANDIARRTGLSMPTIRTRIKLWRGMGIVVRDGKDRRYSVHPSQYMLRSFIVQYSRWRNRRWLRNLLPEAVIIWQWRDEYLFSIDDRVDLPDFLSAGPTRLEELGYDILHQREYYFHHPNINQVSEEEALVQALRTDPNNPRMLRFIKKGIQNRGTDPKSIMEFGEKYDIATLIEKVVTRHE